MNRFRIAAWMLLLLGILPFAAQAQEDGPEVPAPPRTRYRPVLNLNRVPNGVISDFRVKVADYKQSCMNHTPKDM